MSTSIFFRSSIKSAIKKLNQLGSKTLAVVDKTNILKGTISDGDIRRAILKGKKLSDSITSVYNSKPFFLKKSNYDISKLKSIFLKYKIDIIPLVNNSSQYIKSYKFLDTVKKNQKIVGKNILVIVMSGGFGTRLEPFTNVMPKPLMPVGSSTIIELIIAQFSKYGFKNFILTTYYKHQIIDAFFKSIRIKNNIKLLKEKKPLGTAGSLGLIKRFTRGKNSFIVNCDGILNLDLANVLDYHEKNKFDLTIVVALKKFQLPYGVCKSKKDGSFDEIVEKPKLDFQVNTGLYVIKNSLLGLVPKNQKFDMDELINLIKLKKFNIGLYPVPPESWSDIGQWQEYKSNVKNFPFPSMK